MCVAKCANHYTDDRTMWLVATPSSFTLSVSDSKGTSTQNSIVPVKKYFFCYILSLPQFGNRSTYVHVNVECSMCRHCSGIDIESMITFFMESVFFLYVFVRFVRVDTEQSNRDCEQQQ